MGEYRPRISRTDGEPMDAPFPRTESIAPVAGSKRSYNDYFGGTPDDDPSMPHAGDRIWYRNRFNNEWIAAVVLDPAVEGMDEPIGYRSVHLAVDLSRQYRMTSPAGDPRGIPLAASRVGYRMNVVEGPEPGEWQREKPEGADERYRREQELKEQQAADRRQMAAEGGLFATQHVGQLPRGVK
jgi:hypothetical protein